MWVVFLSSGASRRVVTGREKRVLVQAPPPRTSDMWLAEVLLVYRPTILLLGTLLSNWLIFYGLYSDATFLRSLTQKQVMSVSGRTTRGYVWAQLAVNLATPLIVVKRPYGCAPPRTWPRRRARLSSADQSFARRSPRCSGRASGTASIGYPARRKIDSEMDITTRRLFDAQSRMRPFTSASRWRTSPRRCGMRDRGCPARRGLCAGYHVEDLDRRLSALEGKLR